MLKISHIDNYMKLAMPPVLKHGGLKMKRKVNKDV